ncbi:MAG: tyrosine-type recombinase/integrase [Williamsia sp.]|nr:tyrosine-type recombinase/integrase [Williamsia sp.]
MKHLIKINGYFYYNRRVPNEVRDLDPRNIVRVSLKTESRDQAQRKAVILNDQIESYWQTLLDDGMRHDDRRFARTICIARQMGFSYQPMAKVAALPIEELLERILALRDGTSKQVEALLGGRPEPELSVKAALEKFWGFSKERMMNKTPDQIRKWKNPRIKAVENFIAVIGNKDLKAITREDILAFRDWWLGRIQQDGKNPGSANKDFIHFKNVLETVSDNMKLSLDTPYLFKKIVLKTRFKQTRRPFSTDQIIKILESDKLNNLNSEAKWFLYAAAETGARPSEIVGLLPEDIKLNADIPHICIMDRKERTLKTPHSQRTIPLIGYALEAFQNMPHGFPRYRDKPDNLTNAVNQFLRQNDLLPSDQHSTYSFRHSFQDRILSVNMPDRIQAELMGHKFGRPVYGDGASLLQKSEWLHKIQVKCSS